MSNDIAKEKAREASQKVVAHREMIDDLVIDSNDMVEVANTMLRDIREAEKSVEETRDSIIKPLSQSLKAARDLFAPPLQSLKDLTAALSDKILGYHREQERQRAEAARAAEEERRKAMEEAEARRREAEAAAETATTEEELLAAAESIERAEVESSLAEFASAAAPVEARPPKGGHAVLTSFIPEVTSLRQFLQHAIAAADAGDDTYMQLVSLDTAALKKLGKATKGSLKIPGIRFTKEQKLSARS